MMKIITSDKDQLINPSSAILIDLPRIDKPKSTKNPRPQKYWDIYNKGVSFYNRKWYEKAKDEFLKLINHENIHQTFYIYLVRTYRKIIDKQIENQKLRDAYHAFEEFFNVCTDYITNTDRRKFNKLVENLLHDTPNSDFKTKELVKTIKEPDLKIIELNENRLILLSEDNIDKMGNHKRRYWNIKERVGLDTLYIDIIYNKEQSTYDKSFLMVRDRTGNIKKEFILNHGIYRFKSSESSDKFVVSSDNMILYFYSIEDGCLETYDLNNITQDKYHIRCVDISPEGHFLLFTYVDRAYLMNTSSEQIKSWKTPPKEGWEKRISDEIETNSEEYQKNLSILGLSGWPTHEEIKKAFRSMVLKFHPDIRPNDPSATERTKLIINAYEKLTNEEANKAFNGVNNAEYYYKIVEQIKFEIPGTTMSFTINMLFGLDGQSEDWIYATCLGLNADRIYLGCYSGKIYVISKDGNVIKLYNCHEVIRSIREKRCYLFIETDYCLYIIKDDKYLAHIKKRETGNLEWTDSGFMFVDTKELHLFSDDGIEIGSIIFKFNISDIYWVDNNLKVTTANKAYIFSIIKNKD